jgi:bifunctional DNA-binding transcriptional regulator/antitoxin component of YhaV-PrlF toxin-antitoxin module
MIDHEGRITLPKQVLDALGVQPEGEVVLEWTEMGVMIRPKQHRTPITDPIATMNLPTGEWTQMEEEIEFECLSFLKQIDPLSYMPTSSDDA